jgi:hypothetical protein
MYCESCQKAFPQQVDKYLIDYEQITDHKNHIFHSLQTDIFKTLKNKVYNEYENITTHL